MKMISQLFLRVGLSVLYSICFLACESKPNNNALTPYPEDSSSGMDTSDSFEVQFLSHGLELEGILSLPRNISNSSKAPGILLIHGSGPNSRDQRVPGQLNMIFGFEIAMFAELARGLNERGFAVLRYDKRSCGKFNGLCENNYPKPNEDLRIDIFVDDAALGVQYLAQHPRVDEERIFVLGHSQGATFVPHLMTRMTAIRAGIMTAGNHSPIDKVLAWQLEFSMQMLKETGLSQDQVDAQPGIQSLKKISDELAALRAGTHDASPIGGVPIVFWQSYFEQTKRSILEAAELSRPLLSLRGTYDWNISHEEWLAWKNTFASNPDESIVALKQSEELPGITHALNRIVQADWTKLTPSDIGTEVDSRVIDSVVEFCNQFH